MNQVRINLTIPEECKGQRLDKALASLMSDHSRTTIQGWLDSGRVKLDGVQPKRRVAVSGGEAVEIDVPEVAAGEWTAEEIPIDVVFEDESVIVVNKPAGMVVHPGAGNPHGTLLNGLLNHDQSLERLPRAGIVHRLDKNTSGLLVVARTEAARINLIKQFKARTAGRRYIAVVEGRLISGGTIDVAIGRYRHDRKRMTAGSGKPAVSHYRVVARFRTHTLVRVTLETGRTHQIRVHFKHEGFPVVGDPDYGTRPRIPAGASESLVQILTKFSRQALHAELLELNHPGTGERRHWESGVPQDMRELILALKVDSTKFEPNKKTALGY